MMIPSLVFSEADKPVFIIVTWKINDTVSGFAWLYMQQAKNKWKQRET